MKKKIIIMLIIELFIGASIIPVAESISIKNEIISNNQGTNLIKPELINTICDDDCDRVDQYQREYFWCSWYENLGKFKAQSFQPSKSPLVKVKLYLMKEEYFETNITVSIREELNGDDLTYVSIDSDMIFSSFIWVDFDFPDIDVEPEKVYYIIFRVDKPEFNDIFWWADISSNALDKDPYTRGSAWYYSQDDGIWINYDENYPYADYIDHTFETYTYGDNIPPNKPIIKGPNIGKPGNKYNFSFVATDPDNDSLKYEIQWGDNSAIFSFSPIPSGEEMIMGHTWLEEGEYTISARAKDICGEYSEWATFEVEIAKNRAINTPLIKLLQQLPLLYQFFHRFLKI